MTMKCRENHRMLINTASAGLNTGITSMDLTGSQKCPGYKNLDFFNSD